jgi:hypothetical protein
MYLGVAKERMAEAVLLEVRLSIENGAVSVLIKDERLESNCIVTGGLECVGVSEKLDRPGLLPYIADESICLFAQKLFSFPFTPPPPLRESDVSK